MDRRFNRVSSKENMPVISMQRKLAESRRPDRQPEPVPDLTDFMNDLFFGTPQKEPKTYNLTGAAKLEDGHDRGRNNNSKLTQEWLEEARRVIASSPSRHDSPSRRVGSPRFAAASGNEWLDRRDPLSRSARRQRATEGVSGEIISKSTRHSRNRSESFEPAETERTLAPPGQKWFDNLVKPETVNNAGPKQQNSHIGESDPEPLQRQPILRRRSRFQDDPSLNSPVAATPPKPISRRTFKTPGAEPENKVLSPPKHLIESSHRRSISSSTCSLTVLSKAAPDIIGHGVDESRQAVTDVRLHGDDVGRLNLFLKEQRSKMGKISSEDTSAKAKIVLSGASNTSSIVAAICYAWLLENKEVKEEGWEAVVPVMNMKRGRMWKHKQAAWLLYHVGVDASSLIFSDEVDLESLLVAKQLSIMVVGQDVLRTNGEVGSQCTVLTDNYCEDAYDLLQTPYVKKLLLAGILLDTDYLNLAAKSFTNRDAEAVQLLSVGSPPNLRHELYELLMQDQRHKSFLEAMQFNYGTPPSNTNNDENEDKAEEHRLSVKQSTSTSTSKTGSPISVRENQSPIAPAATKRKEEPVSRPKNTFFLAKWFGFGSK